MRLAGVSLALVCGFLLPTQATAGLYCGQETFAPLPSQWRGFLRDQRQLRGIATSTGPLSPSRKAYQQEAARLTAEAARRPLDADEAAELGALLLRLGETARALAILQPAQRRDSRHFRLAANLGTAWQMNGDLSQAAACLEQAVRLAPAADRKNEELHLRLVRGRLRQGTDADGLDDLFGVRYFGPGGYEPGRLAPEQRRRLPADSVARLQQLALWLPADGRLLWQLGELSAVQGDTPTAASILDICFTEFGLRGSELRSHRHALRAAVEALRRDGRSPVHEVHAGLLRPRSPAPLVRKPAPSELPAVGPGGVIRLSWSLLAQTHMDRHYRPTFAEALRGLEGKRVQMEGFLQPLNEEDLGVFLLVENPVGCWHCEQPDVTAIVRVQMPAGKEHHYTRGGLRVTGRLKLNASDPESFLYVLQDAEVADVD